MTDITNENTSGDSTASSEPQAIGQGIIISDIGLILVDSSLIKEGESYKVILEKKDYNVSILKKFDNGFSILKISTMTIPATPPASDTTTTTQ